MKTALILVIVVSSITIFSQVLVSKSVKKTEEYSYKVLKTFDDFEIREYEEALFTSTDLSGDSYSSNSGSGFRILAGYIFGGNESGEKIAMTSPVAMEMKDNITMMFKVPNGYFESDLPQPNDERVTFVRVPKRIVAIMHFGGWANDDKIKTYSTKLREALKREGISHKSECTLFGYNPPYDLVNRRNEVVFELIDFQNK